MLNIIWNCVFGFFCNWFIFLLGNCVSNSVIGTLTLCSARTRARSGGAPGQGRSDLARDVPCL